MALEKGVAAKEGNRTQKATKDFIFRWIAAIVVDDKSIARTEGGGESSDVVSH
jgi:hypothetical protein